jgi:hypothetical protein
MLRGLGKGGNRTDRRGQGSFLASSVFLFLYVSLLKALMTNYLIPALRKQAIATEDFYDGN